MQDQNLTEAQRGQLENLAKFAVGLRCQGKAEEDIFSALINHGCSEATARSILEGVDQGIRKALDNVGHEGVAAGLERFRKEQASRRAPWRRWVSRSFWAAAAPWKASNRVVNSPSRLEVIE
jgi:hypothetical protein